jgi:hypothetical protein
MQTFVFYKSGTFLGQSCLLSVTVHTIQTSRGRCILTFCTFCAPGVQRAQTEGKMEKS